MPEIRDPIHGFISISEEEMKIIDTPIFQRLRRIHQLATTYLLYPAAEHTRFPHSIGVMHVATLIFDKLVEKRKAQLRWSDEDINRYRQMLRLAALLHDIGHAPFSHVSDSLFHENVKDHEGMAGRIITDSEITPLIDKIGSQYGFKAPIIAAMVTGQVFSEEERLLCDIFASEFDADKMDYLLRDSIFAGVKYGYFDLERILNVITLFPREDRWYIGIEHDGVEAVEGLILARYFMFVQVYSHRTRRVYDKIMGRLLIELLEAEYGEGKLPTSPQEFINWDDYKVLVQAKSHNSQWADMFLNRRHLSCVYETELASTKEEREYQRKADSILKEELEKEFDPRLVIVDLFRKAPVKFSLADDKTPTINIVSKDDPTVTSSLKVKAPVVRNLEEPIYAFRVYADDSIAKDVRNHIKMRKEIIIAKLRSENKEGGDVQ